MKRRMFLAGLSATALPAPRIAQAQGTRVLRFIPQTDLTVLDPVWTTDYATRDHANMVFDTLYGTDRQYRTSPQMVAGHVVEDDGRLWTLSLRDGLLFHDGTPVLARDCVASIRRWGQRDPFGQALLAATDALSAPDDRTIRFRLKKAFPLLPAALAKPSPSMCAMMPERLASTDPLKPVPELVGSGPFRFLPADYMSGARAAYARFDGYVPREGGTPTGTAGPKRAHFERVEWITMPDASAAASALRAGEVDWLETPSPDLAPLLKRDRNLRVEVTDRQGLTPLFRFNCIQPPFDNVALRRAVLGAVDQSEFMQAYSSDPETWHVKLGMFCPGTPLANDAGFDRLFGKTDIARAKAEVAASGYKGEKVAFLLPMDHPISAPLSQVAIDLFQRIGLNVEAQAMDTGTLYARRNSREPVEKGGWSIFPSMVAGLNLLDPGVHIWTRGNGAAGWFGWPTSPEAERLREAWFYESDPAKQQALGTQIQVQAWQDATIIPTGQIFQPMAWRRDIDGMVDGFVKFWNVRRV